MSEKKRKKSVPKGEERRGFYGGVRGLTYWTGGYYLSPAQFGYTTAQAPTEGLGGGQMTTATGGGESSGGGDAGAGGGAV